jgi:hypothetical protein
LNRQERGKDAKGAKKSVIGVRVLADCPLPQEVKPEMSLRVLGVFDVIVQRLEAQGVAGTKGVGAEPIRGPSVF